MINYSINNMKYLCFVLEFDHCFIEKLLIQTTNDEIILLCRLRSALFHHMHITRRAA